MLDFPILNFVSFFIYYSVPTHGREIVEIWRAPGVEAAASSIWYHSTCIVNIRAMETLRATVDVRFKELDLLSQMVACDHEGLRLYYGAHQVC